jgi:hypothetical protein
MSLEVKANIEVHPCKPEPEKIRTFWHFGTVLPFLLLQKI